jgi:NAD-dependent dihydropyrimidine dehydrogenase PreA subunit
MAFVITDRCIGVLDRGCVDACPVDCIYEGEGMLHIHPTDCIDCQACMGVCPAQAIFPAEALPEGLTSWRERAERWFAEHPKAEVALNSFQAERLGAGGGAR